MGDLMAGRKTSGQAPRCQEPRKDGTPCGTAVENGEDKCAFHLANPPDVASVAEAAEAAAVVDVPDPDSEVLAVERTRVAPGDLRARLAKDLGDGYDQLVGTLADAMEGATAAHWIACADCGHKSIYVGPDYRTRLDAAAKWVELGLGRKREDPVSTAGRLDEAGVKDPLDMDAEERAALMLAMAGNFPSVFVQARELLDDARAAGLSVDKILGAAA